MNSDFEITGPIVYWSFQSGYGWFKIRVLVLCLYRVEFKVENIYCFVLSLLIGNMNTSNVNDYLYNNNNNNDYVNPPKMSIKKLTLKSK